MAIFKTRSELRLEELEALKRPLAQGECAELRRCIHAIYMRNWRLEQSVMGPSGDLLDLHKRGTVEANAIAYRMENATDENWPIPGADKWEDAARIGSNRLRDAIHEAQARARAA